MTEVCSCRTIAISAWDPVQLGRDPRCPIHATLTASEVKVLTEAALRLGRKEAGEEIAAAIAAEYVPVHNVGGAEPIPSDPTEWDEALHVAVQIARNISSQPSGAVSDASSGAPEHQEVSEAVRSPQEPREDFVQPNRRITQAELDAQARKGWTEFHPEEFCHRCGGPNISWHVDSQAWNRVMRPDGETGRWAEIICPLCFVELAGDPHVEIQVSS
jgi:hypothetical protein